MSVMFVVWLKHGELTRASKWLHSFFLLVKFVSSLLLVAKLVVFRLVCCGESKYDVDDDGDDDEDDDDDDDEEEVEDVSFVESKVVSWVLSLESLVEQLVVYNKKNM